MKFEKSRKLPQIKICCILLIQKSFEVKTQFECHIAYKSNHIFRNSMKFHWRCFDF
jgi:hypothetical protein